MPSETMIPAWVGWLWKAVREAGIVDTLATVLGPIVGALGMLASLVEDRPVGMPWWAWLVTGVVVFLVALAWATGTKAYRMEKEREPKISISNPSRSPLLLSQQPHVTQYQIKITNESYSAITECEVREEGLGPLTGEIKGLNRPFMQSHEISASNLSHVYSKSFDLNGLGASQTIEIAGHNSADQRDGVVMLYATDPTAVSANYIPRSRFPHRLVISITANNMSVAVKREYWIGFDVAGKFLVRNLEEHIGDALKKTG